MIDWTLVAFGILVGAIVLILARVVTAIELRAMGSAENYDPGDGLQLLASRRVAGANVFELAPIESDEKSDHISVEVCSGGSDEYTRILVDFPTILLRQVRLMKENRELYRRYLQRREVEIGDEAFDNAFLVLAPNVDYVRDVVDDGLSAELVTLCGQVNELQIDPAGFFLQNYKAMEADELRDLVAVALRLAGTYHRRAKEIEDRERTGVDESKRVEEVEGHVGLHVRMR